MTAPHDRPLEMTLLKRDVFGAVSLVEDGNPRNANPSVVRDTTVASPWARLLARRLAAREARALARLRGVPGVPELLSWDGRKLARTYISGQPMQNARPADRRYFRAALRLVRLLHAAGVVHNDLAKEPNWLVDSQGLPAVVDFQLAIVKRRRNRLTRMLAHDDLRHMLKHKRTYCPGLLTTRERRILESPSPVSRAWMHSGKPVYLFVTRRLLGWADREGAGDRTQ